jgi:hypothetical protein
MQEVAIPHKRATLDDVLEGVYSVVEDFEKIADSMERMQSRQLNMFTRHSLANAALNLRYDLEKDSYPSKLAILKPRRNVDEYADLWTTFNVVQENLLKGGMKTSENLQGNPPRTVRPVQSISENIRLNKELWNLAEVYS